MQHSLYWLCPSTPSSRIFTCEAHTRMRMRTHTL
jgi:hypothetical protein